MSSIVAPLSSMPSATTTAPAWALFKSRLWHRITVGTKAPYVTACAIPYDHEPRDRQVEPPSDDTRVCFVCQHTGVYE
jgi:hypothetical protein